MRQFLLGIAAWVALIQVASADIAFTITQSDAGPIPLGNSVVFTINIASTTGTINNLAGIDFAINANDPGLTGSVTSGGRFTAGTEPFFPGGSGSFKLGFPTSFQIFGASTGVGQTLTSTPTPLATLTLSTVGAVTGDYALNLTNVQALNLASAIIPVQVTNPFTYSIIAAVPEPTSLLFTAAALGVGGRSLWKRRRRMNQATSQPTLG